MPAKSKSQLRYLYAVAAGKVKGSMTPEQANEWIHATNTKKLPERKKKK